MPDSIRASLRDAFYRLQPAPKARHQPPRRCVAYCIGYGKSGTHTISIILSDRVRSCHEPETPKTISLILRNKRGLVSREKLLATLRERDARLSLEMESSCLLIHFAKELIEINPDSKFIATIREPFSSLNSSYNHMIEKPVLGSWRTYDRWKYGPDQFDYNEIERPILQHLKLPTPRSILRSWTRHYTSLESVVPEERLLFIRTDKISESLDRINAFLGLPSSEAVRKKHHYRNPVDHGIVKKFPSDYLKDALGSKGTRIRLRHFPDYE